MNRTEREVSDYKRIVDILKRCNTIRIAFRGNEYPYVVPVSFGVNQIGDTLFLYFHGAKSGLKINEIKRYAKVCFEGDIFYKVEEWAHGITTRYESVIGFGDIELVGEDEKITGLKSICTHYDRPDYPIGRCRGLEMTDVYKITVKSITGKTNLPIH